MGRILSWDEYFMGVAKLSGLRSKDPNTQVGCCIVNQDKRIVKILILNKERKPVLPCGKCRDLLIELGHESALILFDFGELKTMTMKELNPYYKDEEVL